MIQNYVISQSGKAVAELGLAINNEYITQSGEKRKDTVFVQVETWGKQAENAKKYLSKGSPILVEGSLKYDTWETQEGEKKSRLKISASSIQFLSSKGRGESEVVLNRPMAMLMNPQLVVEQEEAQNLLLTSTTIEEDDIPF